MSSIADIISPSNDGAVPQEMEKKMAFNLVEKGRGRGGEPIENRVACFCGNGSMNITFSADVLAALGSPAAMTVFVGSGEDGGSLFLEASSPADKAAYSVNKNSNSIRKVTVSLSRIGASSDAKFGITPVNFRFADGGVVVALPAALFPPAAATAASPQRIRRVNSAARAA